MIEAKLWPIAQRLLLPRKANNISHLHLDVIFGEFVLYTNTSFWVLIIALIKLFKFENLASLFEAILVILGSAVILAFTSPLFKHQYLSALEIIKEKNDIRDALPPASGTGTSTSGGTSSSQSGGGTIPAANEHHHVERSPEGQHDVLQTGPDEIRTGDLA